MNLSLHPRVRLIIWFVCGPRPEALNDKRRTNASDYLLGGLVVCKSCGHQFVVGAARGNRYRYRYYTCYKRHRYGKNACSAERLPLGTGGPAGSPADG